MLSLNSVYRGLRAQNHSPLACGIIMQHMVDYEYDQDGDYEKYERLYAEVSKLVQNDTLSR
jgi:hypothetical protein